MTVRERVVGELEHYERNVKASQGLIARGPVVIRDLLAHSNYAWAAQNCKITADAFVDLGLLYWRKGQDPRREFQGAEGSYLKLLELVRKHINMPLSKNRWAPMLQAATLFLNQSR